MSIDDISSQDISRQERLRKMPADPDPQLPLTEPTFYILLSLAPGQKHGYAIMKDVEALSDGRLSLSTGTLYGALKRLLDQDWIERVDETEADEPRGEPGRPRKAYRLTRLGRRSLEAETARLERLVAAARVRRVVRRA
jgi:DNA-binding PadR family transcriptional regulator